MILSSLSSLFWVLSVSAQTSGASVANGLARLEQPDGTGIYFGAWYDRLRGDSPLAITERVNYRNFSIWQSDMNITDTLQAAEMDQFLDQVAATKSDAIVYLTLYPYNNYDGVSDKAIQDLIVRVKRVVDNGGRMFIRYASEMNGGWFPYGQQPESFIRSWRRIVDAVRKAVRNPQNLAFIWAPNSANGYPFLNQTYSATNRSAEFRTLDTNGNGLFDEEDDPYTPYYPGDEWVDWVGFSIYHYGREYPWETNDVPVLGKVESILTGRNGFGFYNMYRMFAGDGVGGRPASKSRGGKPFIVTENGATVHLAFANNTAINQTAGVVNIKRTWWREYLNASFLAAYPKVKAICTFEFVKFEETTWRDFTNFGTTNETAHGPTKNELLSTSNQVLNAFREDAQGEYGRNIIWAKPFTPTPSAQATNISSVKSTNNAATRVSLLVVNTSTIMFLFSFLLSSFLLL